MRRIAARLQGRRAVQLHEAVLDVTPAQGGWEEELGKEGGAAEKKEVALSPPESSLLCFCNRLRLHLLFFFCWDMGYQGYPAVRCPLPFPKFGAPSPIADIHMIYAPAPPFLHALHPRRFLLPPQPPWCGHLLPVCACAATTAPLMYSTSHSPKADRAAVSHRAHQAPALLSKPHLFYLTRCDSPHSSPGYCCESSAAKLLQECAARLVGCCGARCWCWSS